MTQISGYVKDKNTQEPLPGANVAVYSMYEGSSTPIKGTTTDANGYFEINVAQNNYIEITYIGYSPNYPLAYTGGATDYFMVPDAVHNPVAFVTAKRTYHKYIIALLVLALIYLIYKS